MSRLIDVVTDASLAAGADPNDRAVHRLRVSIRRFSEALRAFEDVLPRKAAKSVRSELRLMMKLAAGTRNRDIAGELLKKAGLRDVSSDNQQVDRDTHRLTELLAEWHSKQTLSIWRERLTS